MNRLAKHTMDGLDSRIIDHLANGSILNVFLIFIILSTKTKTSLLSSSPTTSNLDSLIYLLVQPPPLKVFHLLLNVMEVSWRESGPNLFTGIWVNDT